VPAKTLRLQIIKPMDTTWDVLGELLRDLRYNSAKICNRVIQLCYENENIRKMHKELYGETPKDTDIYGMSFQGWLYQKIRDEFPEIASTIISQTIQYAYKRWRTAKKDILSLKQSIPSFKLDTPISIYNQSYRIENDGDNWTITTNLLPAQKEKQYKYTLLIHSGDNSKITILKRLIDGEYKQGAMQIVQDRKKKWYCLITYSFETKAEKELDDTKIMGVDMGIVNAVYWAFNDSLQRGKIEGGEIEQFRKQIQRRREELQRAIKWAGDSRHGHGVKRALKPIEALREKERNARNMINHKYAKTIVEAAYSHGCGVIQLEDLSGINEEETFLKNWSYFDLQEKIIYKAEEKGIQVIKINPEYTSQRCSECGYIDKENRKNQAEFKCINCGYEALADYNAARNIAIQNIEKIIEEELKKQEARVS